MQEDLEFSTFSLAKVVDMSVVHSCAVLLSVTLSSRCSSHEQLIELRGVNDSESVLVHLYYI